MSRTPESVWAAIAAGKARLADRAEAERLAAAERDDEVGDELIDREALAAVIAEIDDWYAKAHKELGGK